MPNQDLNKNKGMKPGSGAQDKGQQHQAPGRDAGENVSTGGRSGPSTGSEFDREDREREQPGSKQKDRGQNY